MKTFYHGTSDILPIKNILLPANQTGNLREDWRKKLTNKVFFTDSLMSAQKYAKKSTKKLLIIFGVAAVIAIAIIILIVIVCVSKLGKD